MDDCGDNSDEDHCDGMLMRHYINYMIYNVILVSDVDFLPFMRLRTTNGVVKKDLPPADDATSIDIDIPNGLALDSTSQITAYVSVGKQLYSLAIAIELFELLGCNKWIFFFWSKSNIFTESSTLQ